MYLQSSVTYLTVDRLPSLEPRNQRNMKIQRSQAKTMVILNLNVAWLMGTSGGVLHCSRGPQVEEAIRQPRPYKERGVNCRVVVGWTPLGEA